VIECRHAVKQDERRVHCAHLSAAIGTTCSPNIKICQACQAAGGPTRPVLETPVLRRWVKSALRVALTDGNCPRYKRSPGFDLAKAFATFAGISTRREQREMIKGMFRRQSAIPEKRGGHPPDVVVDKILAIAAKHDLLDALAEI